MMEIFGLFFNFTGAIIVLEKLWSGRIEKAWSEAKKGEEFFGKIGVLHLFFYIFGKALNSISNKQKVEVPKEIREKIKEKFSHIKDSWIDTKFSFLNANIFFLYQLFKAEEHFLNILKKNLLKIGVIFMILGFMLQLFVKIYTFFV